LSDRFIQELLHQKIWIGMAKMRAVMTFLRVYIYINYSSMEK